MTVNSPSINESHIRVTGTDPAFAWIGFENNSGSGDGPLQFLRLPLTSEQSHAIYAPLS
jgi:hypothetical protein